MVKQDDVSQRPSWPLTRDEARQWARYVESLLFPAVFASTLCEWAKLRQRCRLKALSRREAARLGGLLQNCHTNDSLFQAFDALRPASAYAALFAIRCVCETDDAWMELIDQYRDEQDHKERAVCVIVKRSVAWLESQPHLFEFDEEFGRDDS